MGWQSDTENSSGATKRSQHSSDAELAPADEREPVADGGHAECAVHAVDDGGAESGPEHGGEPHRQQPAAAGEPTAPGADAHDDAADVAANAVARGPTDDDESTGDQRDSADPAGDGAAATGCSGTCGIDGNPTTAAWNNATSSDGKHTCSGSATGFRRLHAANAERNDQPGEPEPAARGTLPIAAGTAHADGICQPRGELAR